MRKVRLLKKRSDIAGLIAFYASQGMDSFKTLGRVDVSNYRKCLRILNNISGIRQKTIEILYYSAKGIMYQTYINLPPNSSVDNIIRWHIDEGYQLFSNMRMWNMNVENYLESFSGIEIVCSQLKLLFNSRASMAKAAQKEKTKPKPLK